MIYGNHEILESFLPKTEDYAAPSLHYADQPISMGNLISERNKLNEELRAIKDPTFREPFEAPSLPFGYISHDETDSTEVKALGQELNKRIAYVQKSLSDHEAALLAFQAAVDKRSQDEADYQTALTRAVEAGADIPDPVEHEDLAPLHKTLSKLEGAITVGATVAHASRALLDEAYLNLYASDSYRKWAEKEISKRTQDAAKALELLRTALGARESVLSNLPDAFSDADGVAFVEPVNLGRGGMDPYAEEEKAVSLSEALSKVESLTIPGDGIGKWSKSQLTDEELEDYAERSAIAKVSDSE